MRRIILWIGAAALSQPLSAQTNDTEARNIFRAWQLLDAQPEAGPWDDYKDAPIVGAIWQNETTDGDTFWIDQKDMSSAGGAITFWMRGNHMGNAKVKYRTSLWRMRIYCGEKTLQLLATSTFAPDGSSIDNKDYNGYRSTAIRPDTIYSDIAEKFCSK